MATITSRLRLAGPLFLWRLGDAVEVLAGSYAVVAAAALLLSRCGFGLFGIHEPIIELTAVHYTFAGSAALVLAGAAARHTRGRWHRIGLLAVGCTAAAPPASSSGRRFRRWAAQS